VTRFLTIQINHSQITQKNGSSFIAQGVGPILGQKYVLTEERPGKFRANGKDFSGNYQRKWFDAPDLESAVVAAESRIFGLNPDPKATTLHIADVFLRWRETLTCTPETIKEYFSAVDKFLAWVEGDGLHFWQQLRMEHFQRYIGSLKQHSYADDYIYRLASPIRQASRWAARNWPEHFRNFSDGVWIPRARRPLHGESRGFLKITEVADLCLWLRDQPGAWNVLPGIALQGLCGLRLREVCRLEISSVDLGRGILTVGGLVKNDFSRRTIPLPSLVALILQESPGFEGKVVAYSDSRAYSRWVRKWFLLWRPEMKLEPKGLRRTLKSDAKFQGWDGNALKSYMGWAPQSIDERHYDALSIEQRITLHQEQVVARIDGLMEDHLEAWSGTGNLIRLAKLQ